MPGLAVDHAERAQLRPVGRGDRATGVETDVGVAQDKGIVREADVGARVVDLEDIVAADGVGAEGEGPRGLRGVQALPRLEPLAVLIDQAHEGDGDVEQPLRHPGDPVEALLGRSVEQAGCPQRTKPAHLFHRHVGVHHGPTFSGVHGQSVVGPVFAGHCLAGAGNRRVRQPPKTASPSPGSYCRS